MNITKKDVTQAVKNILPNIFYFDDVEIIDVKGHLFQKILGFDERKINPKLTKRFFTYQSQQPDTNGMYPFFQVEIIQKTTTKRKTGNNEKSFLYGEIQAV